MENDKTQKTKDVKTLTDDMMNILEKDKGGLIKKIIHEEEEREAQKKSLSPENLKNKALLWVGIVLVVVSFSGIVLTLLLNEKIRTAPIEPQFTPIIFTDKNSFIGIDSAEDKKAVALLVEEKVRFTDVKIGGIEGIHLTENGKTIKSNDLFEKIKGNFPPEGAKYISDDFLLGASHDSEGKKNLFILLKVRSFTDIFPHMGTWEKRMFFDLHDFFNVKLTPETSYLQVKEFEDGVVSNKNSRILYDNEENIVMMYVFADENSVIITNSMTAVNEVMSRLIGSKVKK